MGGGGGHALEKKHRGVALKQGPSEWGAGGRHKKAKSGDRKGAAEWTPGRGAINKL